MARVLAIDYGGKRSGIAVTDPDQIIATPLTTVLSKDLLAFLKEYVAVENVVRFVVGLPKKMDNTNSDSARFIDPFVIHLSRQFPDIPVDRVDERFTSKMAFQAMIDSGMKKKDRQNKATVDKISAALILQSWLNSKQ
ncbi:MAG: Holliday junction resolvase RuvX [Bacteroidales bacterium]|nr:Holliday junction resolvase RuvX [Bacteroidales bacterium]